MKKIFLILVMFSLANNFANIVFSEEQIKELTLQDTIESALSKNLDLEIERYNPEISDTQIAYQNGIFYPYLNSTIRADSSSQIATSDLEGAPKLENKNVIYNFGVSYLSSYGTDISVSFQNTRYDTNSFWATLDPRYSSTLAFNVTQPLLKNFGKDNTKYLVIQAKNNKEVTASTYRQKVLDTILATQNAYWDTVHTYENYEVKKYSLDLAKKLLQDTQAQVDVGTLAPIEILTAKAEVAMREEQLIAAENLIQTAENILKTLIDNSDDPDSLTYHIKPIDTPDFEKLELDSSALFENAFENRPEIDISDVNIRSREVDEKYFQNKLLPDLNLRFNLGLSGQGGTQLIYEGLLDRQLIATIPGGYSDALSQLFGADNHSWSLGFEFIYPIFGKQEKANYLKAQYEKDKAIITKKRLKQQIIIEIENALREIQYNFKRIEAAKASTTLQEEKLKAEEKKLSVGLSTNFYVLKYQEDLSVAKSNELAAIIAYRKAIAQLEHAISAPLPQSRLKWEIKPLEMNSDQ